MSRVLWALLLFPAMVAAQGFDEMLARAERFFWEAPAGMAVQQRLDRQYEMYGEIALKFPRRWETYFNRGLNRCKTAYFMRSHAEGFIAGQRAYGVSAATVERSQAEADEWIRTRIRMAHHDFTIMERKARERREANPDVIRCASAAMKMANQEYERAKRGLPGAITDFKALHKKKFMPRFCEEQIALCYLDLGYEAFKEGDNIEAHQHWDEALRWTKQRLLREFIFTNKAAAYEMENEFGLAEKVLREQIEREPFRPVNHKNLGLVLGYQNRLRESLIHYRRARELCTKAKAAVPLGILHGNAWLRPAVIHGELLEQDGDMYIAWRLFMEYRHLLGDDYNFSFWFGRFLSSVGRYELAWTFLERARDLQPHCPQAYNLLVFLAPRLKGTREEVNARLQKTKAAYDVARANFNRLEEDPSVKRLCAGLRDLADLGGRPEPSDRMDPDPLEGFGPADRPPWLAEAAERRQPFVPWKPGDDPGGGYDAGPTGTGPDIQVRAGGNRWLPFVGVGVGALALVAVVFFFVVRRRARPA